MNFSSAEALRKAVLPQAKAEHKALRLLYMGSPDFAVPPFKALLQEGYRLIACATQPDRPVGRKQKLTPTPLKQAAAEAGLPVYSWTSLKKQEAREELRSLKPDLIITAAYGLILPPEILALPLYGCLNLHPSKLPLYRGASPVQAAILAGEKETAASLMRMAEGLDSGPLIASVNFPLGRLTAAEAEARLAELSAELLVKVLPSFLSGEIQELPQDEARAVYCGKLSRTDGALDFSRSAAELDAQIRALQPWPGTFAYYRGEKHKILEAEILPEDQASQPGEILRADKELWLATGQGLLKILRLQLPSGKILPAADCAHNFQQNEFFVSGNSPQALKGDHS